MIVAVMILVGLVVIVATSATILLMSAWLLVRGSGTVAAIDISDDEDPIDPRRI